MFFFFTQIADKHCFLNHGVSQDGQSTKEPDWLTKPHNWWFIWVKFTPKNDEFLLEVLEFDCQDGYDAYWGKRCTRYFVPICLPQFSPDSRFRKWLVIFWSLWWVGGHHALFSKRKSHDFGDAALAASRCPRHWVCGIWRMGFSKDSFFFGNWSCFFVFIFTYIIYEYEYICIYIYVYTYLYIYIHIHTWYRFL